MIILEQNNEEGGCSMIKKVLYPVYLLLMTVLQFSMPVLIFTVLSYRSVQPLLYGFVLPLLLIALMVALFSFANNVARRCRLEKGEVARFNLLFFLLNMGIWYVGLQVIPGAVSWMNETADSPWISCAMLGVFLFWQAIVYKQPPEPDTDKKAE
jgi:hypothetical protein